MIPDKFESESHYIKTWDRIFKAEVQSLLLQSKKAESRDERPQFNFEHIPEPKA
jgi:hypothetical protein